ncbi:hypothetical protein SETIT_3G046900v2 [Setaria italica]|uniref:Uncharacterized protein n=1 Tax=Setaria italica TaxID=4555 RepID=A0A368QBI4_SETIT|nr:hypothetical protein SETIT_3G046900v2 [Setaria italica]
MQLAGRGSSPRPAPGLQRRRAKVGSYQKKKGKKKESASKAPTQPTQRPGWTPGYGADEREEGSDVLMHGLAAFMHHAVRPRGVHAAYKMFGV